MSRYRISESVGSTVQAVQQYADIEIHHPSRNAKGLRSGNAQDFERNSNGSLRPHARVDGRWEEVRLLPDNRVLVKKDLVLSHDGHGPVMVPCPVEGYLRFNRNYGTAEIYDRSGAGAVLLGKVLHMKPETFRHLHGKQVRYGDPLGEQWEAGRGGLAHAKDGIGIHAHIELEPVQFRRYIDDLVSGAITSEGYRPSQATASSNVGAKSLAESLPPPITAPADASGISLQATLNRSDHVAIGAAVLAADWHRGEAHEVRSSQVAHGVVGNGKMERGTREALPVARESPLISETTHPYQPLYQAIGKRLPDGTAGDVIAHITSQAVAGGIRTSAQLARVDVVGNDVFVQGAVAGQRIKADLSLPVPDLQQISDQLARQAVEVEPQRQHAVRQAQVMGPF